MRTAKRLGIIALCMFFATAPLYALYVYGMYFAPSWSDAYDCVFFLGCLCLPVSAVLGIVSLGKWVGHSNPFRAERHRALRLSGWITALTACACVLVLSPALPMTHPRILTRVLNFAPYRSLSPDGQYVLAVRKTRDEPLGSHGTVVSLSAHTAFSVLDAETGDVVYDCPDVWVTAYLWGIDWLCDGTVFVASGDFGLDENSHSDGGSRYGPDENGIWAELDHSGPSGMPVSWDDHMRVWEENGWRTVVTAGDSPSLKSFDAEGTLRLDTDYRFEW